MIDFNRRTIENRAIKKEWKKQGEIEGKRPLWIYSEEGKDKTFIHLATMSD